MHNLFKLLFVLNIIILCNACDSTEDGNLNPTPTSITAENLNGFYIPYQDEAENGNQRFRVVYFVKEEESMKAYLDGQGLRRIAPLTISDNKFVFDLNSDGTTVLNFNFSKNDAGKIALTSLTKTGSSATTVVHYEMFSPTETPSWGGFTFERSTGVSSFFKYYKFSGNETFYANDVSPNTDPDLPCYELGNGIGFKSNSEIIMGIFVPSWKGDTNVKMLLSNKNISTVALYNYYN